MTTTIDIAPDSQLMTHLKGLHAEIAFVLDLSPRRNLLVTAAQECLNLAEEFKERLEALLSKTYLTDLSTQPGKAEESAFVELCRLGEKVFFQPPIAEGRSYPFPRYTQKHKESAQEAWQRFDALVKDLLPGVHSKIDAASAIREHFDEISRLLQSGTDFDTLDLKTFMSRATRVTATIASLNPDSDVTGRSKP